MKRRKVTIDAKSLETVTKGSSVHGRHRHQEEEVEYQQQQHYSSSSSSPPLNPYDPKEVHAAILREIDRWQKANDVEELDDLILEITEAFQRVIDLQVDPALLQLDELAQQRDGVEGFFFIESKRMALLRRHRSNTQRTRGKSAAAAAAPDVDWKEEEEESDEADQKDGTNHNAKPGGDEDEEMMGSDDESLQRKRSNEKDGLNNRRDIKTTAAAAHAPTVWQRIRLVLLLCGILLFGFALPWVLSLHFLKRHSCIRYTNLN